VGLALGRSGKLAGKDPLDNFFTDEIREVSKDRESDAARGKSGLSRPTLDGLAHGTGVELVVFCEFAEVAAAFYQAGLHCAFIHFACTSL